jgi:hypothetical protein
MPALLWSLNQLAAFVVHPDAPVRKWALNRLSDRFPEAAPAAVVPLLDDPDTNLLFKAAELIGASSDPERFRSALLERLPAAQGERFGRLAVALARLDPNAARPFLLERARLGRQRLQEDEYLLVVEGLGHAGGGESRQALWQLLGAYTRDAFGAMAVVESLLQIAPPGDIRRLVQRLRAWPPSRRLWRSSTSALAAAANVERLFEEMAGAAGGGLRSMLEQAEGWLGRPAHLNAQQTRALARAFRDRPAEMFPLLQAEAVRLLAARQDDVAGWRAQWESGVQLSGYRRQAVLSLLILEALLSPLLPHANRLRAEAILALSLVCQLAVDRDDEGALAAAVDPAQALLAILAQPREHVLPDILERVAKLGPAAVPGLVPLLHRGQPEWGAIRAARAVALLARQWPEACASAIPALLERMTDREGDFVLEACAAALSAIGPPAVEPIAAALDVSDDLTREIYLIGVLGDTPAERSSEVILSLLSERAPANPRDLEMYVTAVTSTGSPSAIPVLLAHWKPGVPLLTPLLSECLLVLHVVNGLGHPQMAEWRALVQAEDARIAELSASLRLPFNDPDEPLPSEAESPSAAPPPRSTTPTRPVVGRLSPELQRHKSRRKRRR